MSAEKDPKKVAAGRKGGLATFKKYGRDHMREVGRLGAMAFWDKYRVTPLGTSDFAIYNKSTGEFVNTMNGDFAYELER